MFLQKMEAYILCKRTSYVRKCRMVRRLHDLFVKALPTRLVWFDTTTSISQKIDQQKPGESEGTKSSQPFHHGRSQSFQGQPGSVQPYEYQSGSGRLNGHSNGGHYGGLKNGQTLNKSNGASAADTGRSVSPLPYVLCLTSFKLCTHCACSQGMFV